MLTKIYFDLMTPLKKLLRLSRAEWPLLGRGLFFLAVSSGALLAFPQTVKKIIDDALAHRDPSQLNHAALLAIGIFVIQSVASALRYYYFTLAGEQTVKRLRERLFAQILGQDVAFFDRSKTGELLGRLSSDTAVLQNALSVNISMLVRAGVQALGGLAMLFLTSAKLTLFILIVVPPLGFLAARFGKRVKAFSRLGQDALAASSDVAESSLAAVRTVKAFVQEDFERKRYEARLATSFALSREKILEVARFTNLVSLLGMGAVVFIIWLGGRLVIAGELSVGTLTSFLLYVITVAFSVGMLGSLWTDFMSAVGASGRIFELLERPVEDLDAGLAATPAGPVQFRDVRFSYPSRPGFPILNGVSFSVSPKETVAIVGPSGSGKSTIVQLLLGFYAPEAGEITFDGQPAGTYTHRALRESIALVSQEPVLISETLFDNIRYGHPTATEADVVAAAKKAFAHDFIAKFPDGYQTLVGERGIQLSGGQKQRVAIARAILRNPRLLILDEATSSLDTESEHLVQRALEEQLGQRATIVIAHRLSTVKRVDKILVLAEGKIVQTGTHEELLRDEGGLYHGLVQRQFTNQKEII
jgi:ABC-type multidrug transport system fused ATPase/permease subunit